MRTVKLKQNASTNSVMLTVQHPDVRTGWNLDKTTLTIEVRGVPDGVSDHQVMHMYSQTGVFHRQDSDYIVNFKDLGLGRIVQVSAYDDASSGLVNVSTAANVIGITKQAVYSFHQRALKTPNSRSKFPRAVTQDPDGGNPWFDRSEIEAYAEYRAAKSKED